MKIMVHRSMSWYLEKSNFWQKNKAVSEAKEASSTTSYEWSTAYKSLHRVGCHRLKYKSEAADWRGNP
jgi:hypothetical protein